MLMTSLVINMKFHQPIANWRKNRETQPGPLSSGFFEEATSCYLPLISPDLLGFFLHIINHDGRDTNMGQTATKHIFLIQIKLSQW